MPNSAKKLKMVITGGGTGGHIYPAIAVAQKLKQDEAIEKIFYIGCEKNMEKDIAAQENLDFYSIEISGMPRKNIFKIISWFFQLIIAIIQSIKHLWKIKPDVVFGTGGYVSGAVLIAAGFIGIPFVIHDPDARPGLVNRFVSRWASAVSISFEQAKNFLKSNNIMVNGNPIRANFQRINKDNAVKELELSPEKKIIVVIGGSQGAQTINNALLEAAPVLINKYGFQIIHQTGAKKYAEYIRELSQKYPEFYDKSVITLTGKEFENDQNKSFSKKDRLLQKPETSRTNNITDIPDNFNIKNYIVKPFFDNMEIPLNAADIAVSRAGSLSISELNLCGLPSILLPYPFAAADHQKFNAMAMEKAGASILLEDSECTSDKLIELILDILNNAEKLEKMRLANKALAKPDATENIIRILKSAALR